MNDTYRRPLFAEANEYFSRSGYENLETQYFQENMPYVEDEWEHEKAYDETGQAFLDEYGDYDEYFLYQVDNLFGYDDPIEEISLFLMWMYFDEDLDQDLQTESKLGVYNIIINNLSEDDLNSALYEAARCIIEDNRGDDEVVNFYHYWNDELVSLENNPDYQALLENLRPEDIFV